MILGALCLIGFAFAWALGADLRALASIRLRWSALILVALAMQIVVFEVGIEPPHALGGQTGAHLGSYLLLMAFAVRNLRTPGFLLAAAGLASNSAAIFLDGGQMPVRLSAWVESGRPIAQLDNNTDVATSATHFWFLGDVFALPSWVPLANTFSVGDVLLVAGAVLFVYRSDRRERDRTLVRVLDPLRVRDFRTLLVGRTVSKLGDWISLAALVTWIYTRTHSTLGVSFILLARLAASISGSVFGSGLLDRWERFGVLRSVEGARALATLAAIGLVAAGQPYLVAVCVFASYFLASATDPTASSIVADILPPEQRHAGNALHAVSRASVMAVGSIAGGLAAAAAGVLPALAVDVATFALAVLVYSRAVGRAPVSPPEEHAPHAQLRRADVLAFIGRSPGLRTLVASFALATMAMGILNASLPAFLAAHAPHAGGYGVGIGMIAIGLMCGELLSGRVGEGVAARTPALSFGICAAVLAVIASSGLAATIMLLLLLLGLADGATETAYDTLVQRQTPASIRAGVFALGGAIQQLAMGAGFLLAPALQGGSAHLALRASAVALAASAVVGVGVILAGRRPAAGPEPVTPSV